MSAPVANRNAANHHIWKDAVQWALKNYKTSSVKKGLALRAIANKLVESAIEGNKDAWQEIGNRLDGKPVQQTKLTGDLENPIAIVDPTRPKLTKQEWMKVHCVGSNKNK